MKSYTCPVCKKEFSAYQRRTTCSKQCLYKYQSRRETKPCEFCNKEIVDKVSRFRRAKNVFCTRKCQHEWEKLNKVKYLELRNKEWCIKQYETLSLIKIAKMLNCGETTVFKYFKIHGIVLDRKKWLKNVPKSQQQRNKLSEIRLSKQLGVGEKNGNWKGGIYKLSASIRNSKKNAQWKKAVMEISNKVCVLCNSKDRLEVDHIKKFRFILSDNKIESLKDAYTCEELWDVNNGRILCRSCNIGIEADKI